MWENETIVLVTSLRKRILGDGKGVRFGKISEDSAIPTFVKTIFKSRVERYIIEEEPFTLKPTKHFDVKPESLDKLKSKFSDFFREAAFFDQEEVNDILQNALVQRLNYIVKPVDTMRRMLFNGDHNASVKDMESILDSFRGILLYADRLIGECQKKGLDPLTSDEYGRVMSDLLLELYNGDAIQNLTSDFNTLAGFVSETKGEEVTRIEGSVLQEFLADRNQWSFRRALDVEMKLGKKDYNANDFEMTMKRYLELREEFGTKEEAKKVETIKDIAKEETIELPEEPASIMIEEELKVEAKPEEKLVPTEEPIEEKEHEEKEKTNLLEDDTWELGDIKEEKIVQDPELVAETPAPVEKPVEKAKPKAMRIIRREKKKEESEEESKDSDFTFEEPVEKSHQGGIRALIDSKTEKVFIKKLFSGESEAYESLLGKLDDAESWRVAKILIDNELFKRDVDPFSREAIKLVDLVYSLYYPEEGLGGNT